MNECTTFACPNVYHPESERAKIVFYIARNSKNQLMEFANVSKAMNDSMRSASPNARKARQGLLMAANPFVFHQ